jgi:DNA-binding transcriptional LysR family regulator
MTDPLHTLAWDDLRIIKAIGESGSLVAAAMTLDVNHSTISRRLSLVEQTLGVTLFDRRRSGYVPTEAGSEVIALGERVEHDILSVTRRISCHAQGHKGDLRVTTSDALLLDFLTPVIADFQQANPEIRVEVIVSNKPLNLARGDADIALRATLAPPENLFGRKVATIAWAVYGRKIDYPRGAPDRAELDQRRWVSYGKRLAALKAFGCVEDRVAPENIAYRADSVTAVSAAVAAGIGIGMLPCMHGDLIPNIVRIGAVEPDVYDELWILTHPDIRRSARVYAFMTHCAEAMSTQREFIEGCDSR